MSKRVALFLTTILLLATTLLSGLSVYDSGVALAQDAPTGTLDADCNVGFDGDVSTQNPDTPIAQTFTAENSAKLTKAQVQIKTFSTNGDFVLEILAVDSSGKPLRDQVLASAKVAASTVPQGQYSLVKGDFTASDSTATTVEKDKQYALSIRNASQTYTVSAKSNNPCPEGAAYSAPAPQHGGGSFYSIGDWDLLFATYVSLDADSDGVSDATDNCPSNSNSGQEDADEDGTGDACDPDKDGDEVANSEDNCADVSNADQKDADGDGEGDACDSDKDGDGKVNSADNCPGVVNPDQLDSNGDGEGDACDPDKDGDGKANGVDNCPDKSNSGQEDADEDGIGDACETNLPGRMAGRGVTLTSMNERVTHGFQLSCDAAPTGNTLQVNWGDNTFELENLTKVLCGDNQNIENAQNAKFDTYTGEGEGNLNGVPKATVRWTFTDAGEPGSKDSVRITILDPAGQKVLEVSSILEKGNHQAHHEKP